MGLTDEHWEYFIDLVIQGTFQAYASDPSEHPKREYTYNKFEDAIINSFIGFVSEAAFEHYMERNFPGAGLVDGGWFISRTDKNNPIEEKSGIYVTVSLNSLDDLKELYKELESKFQGKLFAATVNPEFQLSERSRKDLKKYTTSAKIFQLHKFEKGKFEECSSKTFFRLFNPVDEGLRRWRRQHMKADVYDKARIAIANLVNQLRSFPVDHKRLFFNRLFIDRYFSPHFKKGNISDIDAALKSNETWKIYDIKCKEPFGDIKKYGLNEYKLHFYSKIDSWSGFKSYYVVNRKKLHEVHVDDWATAPMEFFSLSTDRVDNGGSGRTAEGKVVTVNVEAERFKPFLPFDQ